MKLSTALLASFVLALPNPGHHRDNSNLAEYQEPAQDIQVTYERDDEDSQEYDDDYEQEDFDDNDVEEFEKDNDEPEYYDSQRLAHYAAVIGIRKGGAFAKPIKEANGIAAKSGRVAPSKLQQAAGLGGMQSAKEYNQLNAFAKKKSEEGYSRRGVSAANPKTKAEVIADRTKIMKDNYQEFKEGIHGTQLGLTKAQRKQVTQDAPDRTREKDYLHAHGTTPGGKLGDRYKTPEGRQEAQNSFAAERAGRGQAKGKGAYVAMGW